MFPKKTIIVITLIVFLTIIFSSCAQSHTPNFGNQVTSTQQVNLTPVTDTEQITVSNIPTEPSVQEASPSTTNPSPQPDTTDAQTPQDSTTKPTPRPPSTQQVSPSSKIDLSSHAPCISYNSLSEDAKLLITLVFESIKYDEGVRQFVEVEIPDRFREYISEELYYEIASFFVIYYGSFDHIHQYVNCCKYIAGDSTTYTLELQMETIRYFEKERQRYISYVEAALENMNNGSEAEILNQIARWISSNYVYDANVNTVQEFFDVRRANCNVVSMLFRLFCERLGIHCDVVVGYSSINGKYHAWNRVTLQDGSYRYYDITLYKSLNNSSYLGSAKQLHNTVYINRYILGNAAHALFTSNAYSCDAILPSDNKKKKKI